MDKVHKKRAALARSFMRLSQPYIKKTLSLKPSEMQIEIDAQIEGTPGEP